MININKIDQEIIKLSNRVKILNLVYEKEELTKQEIAKTIGISIPTVISNINELIEEGILEEAGVATSTGGRKPVIIRFKPNSRFSFGVDISPKKVRIILTNLYSNILAEESFVLTNFKNIDEIMEKIQKTIFDIMMKRHISKEKILGIGFSLPGIVNENNLILENAPNLGIKNIELKHYQDNFGIPIYIENEANAAAYAESVLGSAKMKSNLLYISITEGIGTGIIIDDRLYKGKNKKAGEFGHMKISDENKVCNCGRTGCWELYASEKALLHNYNESSADKAYDLIDIFKKYEKNDKLAKEIVDTYLDYLAIGIQNIIFGLSPEYVIIGGEISYFEDVLKKPLEEKVLLESRLYTTTDTEIIFSKLRKNASILGASLLPVHSLFNFAHHII